MNFLSDVMITAACFVISGTFAYVIYRARRVVPVWMAAGLAVFFVALGTAHLVQVSGPWPGGNRLLAELNLVLTVASVGIAAASPLAASRILGLAKQWRFAGQHRDALESTLQDRNSAYRALEARHLELEGKAAAVSAELAETKEQLMAEVAERKRAQTGLAHLASIVDSSQEAILSENLQGQITSWNQGAERVYGYKAAEVLGRPIAILVPPERIDEIADELETVQRGQRIHEQETTRTTKDGRHLDVLLTVSPLRNSADAVVGASVLYRDITQRRRAEEALRRSEEQYRLLFENNPLPMWVFDEETLSFLAVNQAALLHYGYSIREFLAMKISDFHPAEDVSAYLDAMTREGSGFESAGTWRHKTRGETLIDVEIYRHRLVLDGRHAQLALIHDVTEQRRSEQRLRQSEERFSKAFRSGPLAITITTRAEGRYLEVNDAFLQMIDSRREDTVGKTVHDIALWVDLADREKMFRVLDQGGRVVSQLTEFRTRAGDIRKAVISAELISLDGQSCVLAIIEDVTEAKRLEQQLQQTQRMESIGRLAGGVAHDFNNMLGVILGYSELLQERLSPVDPSRENVIEIKRAAQRAAALTRQLLAFSRQQIVQPRVISMNSIVDNISSMLRRMIGEDIELILVLEKSLGSVKADPGQMEQILMNLAVNARDAMPRGGKLIVETSNSELDETYVRRHSTARPGPYILLAVSDTGEGIAAKNMPHIFEPFFTTKPPGKGTGLGLTTVYGVVKQSGGHVWVYSEEGRGTTFKIYLPRVDVPEAMMDMPSVEAGAAGGTETILLAEDEASLRELTREVLRNSGYTVLEAPDAPTALEIGRQHERGIDLLLSDVIMPGMSGRELDDKLRRSHPHLKSVYMSGYADELILHYGILEPTVDLLLKPFTRNSLLSKVRTVLNRK